MIVAAPGLVHLLGSDFRSVCGSEFGLLTSLTSRCTCPTCFAIWNRLHHESVGGPLVTDDADETGH